MLQFKVLILLVISVAIDGVAISSCTMITFDDEVQEDRWSANLRVKVLEPMNGVWIKIDLDSKADVLITNFGETTSTNNQNFIIRNPSLRVATGDTIEAKLIVKFNKLTPIPNITQIIVNGRIICPKSDENIDVRAQEIPQNQPIIGKEGCGVVPEAESLIFNGELSSEGSWPWHVAIMKINHPRVNYICGGSIISENFILTAAHCVTYPKTKTLLSTQSFLIYIGVTRLTDLTIPSVTISIADEIMIPSDYSPETYFNDIALIKLTRNLQFNNFIRPVCLWSEDNDQATITGRLGTVVGWGIDQRNTSFSSDLRHAEIPVISGETCKEKDDFYRKHTNEKTYCAGGQDGKAVCNGDSGGGMLFKKVGFSKTVWQLRGIVSLNRKQDLNEVCNTKSYAIFADAAKHLEWIRKTTGI
ncbi:chymotrypsinogen A-like [Onthophagus taurus]|uniref:chymotrypsinogen A-like n=1 Tax=Onthophagus taurus TaxID=166361 RepID=UPI000C206A67|nr:transmembrane protease serine 12-like [Onthophagus taurus]